MANLFSVPRYLSLALRARRASRYAYARGLPGRAFGEFGRALGRRLLLGGNRELGLKYWFTPVDCVRYFEFDFAGAALPATPRRCLDVSSPRLFSLYVAAQHPAVSFVMTNPDASDLQESRFLAAKLGLSNIEFQNAGVEGLTAQAGQYDCIWSLSVIEHIAGAVDDSAAIRLMYAALAPGGTLILTFPVDRRFWEEYRDAPQYAIDTPARNGQSFFQRFYDLQAIETRLLASIAQRPCRIAWYGEKSPGHLRAYEQRWMRGGWDSIVDDPREMVDHLQPYPTWESMTGVGICGLAILKSPA